MKTTRLEAKRNGEAETIKDALEALNTFRQAMACSNPEDMNLDMLMTILSGAAKEASTIVQAWKTFCFFQDLINDDIEQTVADRSRFTENELSRLEQEDHE